MALEIRKLFLKIYVLCVAVYDCETQTITTTEKSKLEVNKIWRNRKILKIKWIDRKTNKGVLDRIKGKREFQHTIEELK